MFKWSICITCAVLFFAALVCAQESPDGHWEGTITADKSGFGITLDLTKNVKSEWVASMGMSIPAQNGRGPGGRTRLEVQRVTVNGTSVSFVAAEMGMLKFDLTLGAGGIMKGTITSQQGPPESVEFKRTGVAKVEIANPDDPQRLLGKAIAETQSNRPEEAQKSLDRLIELMPNDPQRWRAKAMIEAQSNRSEAALKSFEKLTELQPNDGSNWVGKGQMLEALKRDDDALKAFDKAITLSPRHEAAWNNRGGVLLRFGKYDEAIKSYDKAIELAPKWADSFYYRACAYARMGDKTNALADLKQAIEIQPSLKASAAKEEHFSSLHNDPEFKAVFMVIQSASAQDTLEGVWQYTETIPPGPAANPVPIPPGSLLIFTKTHYSMILVTMPRPELPQQNPTDEQKVAAWTPFYAAAGTYEVKGDTFTIKTSAAKNPSEMVPDGWLTSEFKIEGNTLITTPRLRKVGPINLGSTKLVRVE
jgi:tetratricopeptide (TPR) repeat protein